MTAGVLLAIFFALGWAVLFVFRTEAVTEALPAYAGAERRWVQITPVTLAVHMTAACLLAAAAPRVPWWSALLALGTCAIGIGFWFWGRLLIGPVRQRRLPDEPPRHLRRDGAFGIVRHPLYFGYLLAAAAPLWVVPRALLFATFTLCFVALAVRTTQEERRMRAHLGARYDAYCREVRRLIPFVW